MKDTMNGFTKMKQVFLRLNIFRAVSPFSGVLNDWNIKDGLRVEVEFYFFETIPCILYTKELNCFHFGKQTILMSSQ